MVCEKLLSKTFRYRKIRAFLFLVVGITLFANICIIISTKLIASHGTKGKLSLRMQAIFSPVGQSLLQASGKPRIFGDLFSIKMAQKDFLVERNRLNGQEIVRIHDPVLSQTNDSALTDPMESLPVDCHAWCGAENLSPPYNLTAVLLVRVDRHDLAGLSSREMLQWLFYLRYAGFEHVFVYDAYVSEDESQYDVLTPLVKSGYVTYIDWSADNPYTIEGTQVSAYRDCIHRYGENLTWHIAIDIDEYPFSPLDLEPNFLQRFLRRFFIENPNVSQVTLQNFLFLGKPLDAQANPLLIQRLRRRTFKKANDLGKSVFRVKDLWAVQVHQNSMRSGLSSECPARVLRLNHYWGARLQNWSEDTPKILGITEQDFSIKLIGERLNRCAKCFEGKSLYTLRWN